MFIGLKKEKTRNKFLENKLIFLNDAKYSDQTCENYYRMFKNYCNQLEVIYDKDLMFFNQDEIENILDFVSTSSSKTKENLASLIRTYLTYWNNREATKTNINFIDLIPRSNIEVINKQRLKNKYIGWDRLRDIIKEAKTKIDINPLEELCVVLGRYGLTTDDILELKTYNIVDNFLVINDRKFDISCDIKLIEDCINMKEILYRGEPTLLENDEKILKHIIGRENNYRVVRRYIYKIMNATNNDITLKDLNKSAVFDEIFNIYKRKGFLKTVDFKIALKKIMGRKGESSYSLYKGEFLVLFPSFKTKIT